MKYRMLEKGEILKEGDECRVIINGVFDNWEPTVYPGQRVGSEYANCDQYRRPIGNESIKKETTYTKELRKRLKKLIYHRWLIPDIIVEILIKRIVRLNKKYFG